MATARAALAEALPTYDIGEELGRGAWGVVLAGRHRRLHRDVAIKVLPRAFAVDKGVRARFRTEARLLASLDHPHIVPIYEFVEKGPLCALVMERLGGGTVWDLFQGDGLSAGASCALVVGACAGLHYAHGKGVLHRDIKPENMLLSTDGVLKVADFGIAKVLGAAATVATRAGYVLGTPSYLAPEQASGEALTPATDVYALGTVLYELLAAELPFPEASDPVVAVYQHVHQDPRPLGAVAPTLPVALTTTVDRAIAREVTARYQSAEDFGAAVAAAAAEVWGDGWVQDAGVTLHGASAILSAGRPAQPPGRSRRVGLPTARQQNTLTAIGKPPNPALAAPAVGRAAAVPAASRPKARRVRYVVVALVVMVLVVAGAVAAFLGRHRGPAPRPTASSPTSFAPTSSPASTTTLAGVQASGPTFHTADDIRCAYASDTLTCTLANGKGYAVGADGKANAVQSAPNPLSGDLLASGTKWQRGVVQCGEELGKGLSCYSVSNGHGFFLSPSGSNTF